MKIGKFVSVKRQMAIQGMICAIFVAGVCCEEIEIPSSFNPVGSGARALGIGGAFIAVADDATAASWNPGGLARLRKPEFSVVASGFRRHESPEFGTNPGAFDDNGVFDSNLNYISAVWPFELANRNMVVSVSYQHLFDFKREWIFEIEEEFHKMRSLDKWRYNQDGGLSALGVSYCIQIIPSKLAAGFTLNFWEDSLTRNKWEKKYVRQSSGLLLNEPYSRNEPFTGRYERRETFAFGGFNANVGLLWDISPKWRVGAVLKTPFTADIDHRIQETFEETYPERSETNTLPPIDDFESGELDMPMSYGFGVLYNYLPELSFSADAYVTRWDDYVYTDGLGTEISPITDAPINESDTEPTCQLRFGVEYLLIKDKTQKYVIPVRGGVFYDPAPAESDPDDYYGFTLGTGLTKIEKFSLDIAYQYRFGNDVGKYALKGMDFSQDVYEHTIWLSMIVYSF